MRVVDRAQIETALARVEVEPLIASGFVAYSEGRAVVPPVGELVLDGGEVHVKSGFIRGHEYYVVKVASGFRGNAGIGLPSGNGMMLVFRQRTGEPVAVLVDGGLLTDVRTAAAGAVAARHLGPRVVERIGVIGTGVQARFQLLHLANVTACRAVTVWGRDPEHARRYADEMTGRGFAVAVAADVGSVCGECNLVVTTTPATTPLVATADVRPGTHINAIGSDTPDKHELEVTMLARADVVVADSREQSRWRGEIARAVAAGALTNDDVVEIGDVIAGRAPGRSSDDQITVFDSTGVGVQDVQIATAIVDALGI